MHGSDENCITGARGTQVVNGNTTPGHGAPPAATQVSSSVVSSKVVYKAVSTPPPTPVNTASTSNSVATLCQQGTILNIMSRPGTVTAATPNGTPGAVQLQPGMQIVNVRQNQSTIQLPGGRGLPPRMIVNQIPNIRPGQPGQVTLQTFQGLPPGTQGHLIVKTDNGQLQLVRVNAAPVNPGQIPPNGTQANASTMLVHQTIGNAYRFQQPQPQSTITALTGSTGTTTASQVVNAGGQTVVVPASSIAVSATSTTMAGIMPATVTSTMANNIHGGSQQTTPAVGTQTISAESAKTKCKNFLATLLRLASEQRAKVAQNVRNLIQGLIDGKVEPEAFTEELQKDLNSSPQPCLVPFLKKTLPYLRASLARGELTIEGVRPPPLSAVGPVTGMTTVIPSMLGIAKPTAPTTTGPLRVVTPVQTGTFIQRPTATTTVGQQSAISSPRIVTQVQPLRVANKTLISSVRTHMPSSNTQFTNASNSSNSSVTTVSASQGLMNSVPFTSKASNSRPGSKDDKKKDKNVAFKIYAIVDIVIMIIKDWKAKLKPFLTIMAAESFEGFGTMRDPRTERIGEAEMKITSTFLS